MSGLLRYCVECHASDDHPRHDVIVQLVPEMLVESRHLDCCGCESCAASVAGSDGATGDAMRAHILAKG